MVTNRFDDFLDLAIKSSLIALDGLKGELVLILDVNEDFNDFEIRKAYAKDSRIRIFKTQRRGIVGSLNYGLNKSKYELIARMDSDDIMLPTRLKMQLKEFVLDPNLTLLGSNVVLIDEKGNAIRKTNYPISEKLVRKYLINGFPIAHPTAMFKKSEVLQAGMYSEEYPFAEDLDLWLRLQKFGVVRNLSQVTLFHRIHSNQVSIRFSRLQTKSTFQCILNYRKTSHKTFSPFIVVRLCSIYLIKYLDYHFPKFPRLIRRFYIGFLLPDVAFSTLRQKLNRI